MTVPYGHRPHGDRRPVESLSLPGDPPPPEHSLWGPDNRWACQHGYCYHTTDGTTCYDSVLALDPETLLRLYDAFTLDNPGF